MPSALGFSFIDGLHLFWFCKLARMRVNLAGKKQDKHRSCQIKPRFSDDESLGSEYCLDLENENEKRYKEKSTLSNGELLPDPNVSISLLFIVCKLDFAISSQLSIRIQLMQSLKSDK